MSAAAARRRTALLGTRCIQSTNIYKVKPNLFLVKKMCELAAYGKDREWGRGGMGWQHACAMQTNMVPLKFFSIVAPMVRRQVDLYRGIRCNWRTVYHSPDALPTDVCRSQVIESAGAINALMT